MSSGCPSLHRLRWYPCKEHHGASHKGIFKRLTDVVFLIFPFSIWRFEVSIPVAAITCNKQC